MPYLNLFAAFFCTWASGFCARARLAGGRGMGICSAVNFGLAVLNLILFLLRYH